MPFVSITDLSLKLSRKKFIPQISANRLMWWREVNIFLYFYYPRKVFRYFNLLVEKVATQKDMPIGQLTIRWKSFIRLFYLLSSSMEIFTFSSINNLSKAKRADTKTIVIILMHFPMLSLQFRRYINWCHQKKWNPEKAEILLLWNTCNGQWWTVVSKAFCNS